MSKMIDFFSRTYTFFRDDIWRTSESELTKIQRIGYRLAKTIILAIRGFIKDRLNIRASALTYSIVFAIIPLLALIIAIGKGLGVEKMIEDSLNQSFVAQSDIAPTIMQFVQRYLATTQGGLFIGIGLVILLWSVLNLFMQVENAFNTIWQVRKPRNAMNMFTTYFSTVLVIPIIIVFTSGLSIFVSSAVSQTYVYQVLSPVLRFFVKLIPYALNCIIFTVMYKAVPNTRVQFKHALVAGIIAGFAFQAFQMLYINGQVYLSRYNVVYGSFAAIPLLLLWLQISCLIVLLGAEISYVSQNLQYFEYELDSIKISPRYKKFLTLFITYVIVKQLENKQSPLSAEEISRHYKIPIRLVQQIIQSLIDISVLAEIANEQSKSKEKHFIPAVDINQLTVKLVTDRLNEFGAEDFLKNKNKQLDQFWVKVREINPAYENLLIKDM
jgi:membrane protein